MNNLTRLRLDLVGVTCFSWERGLATMGGMKVYLESIGCRLNQSEVETMARQLATAGHEVVGEAAAADKVVINTCAVTREATRDARALTRRLHRANQAAEIVLTGCYATIAPQEVAALEGAGRVVPNEAKEGLVWLLDPQADRERPLFDVEPLLRVSAGGTVGRTRAFVKVQDGCDNRCTFCVTTIARGAGRSRPMAEVVAEIQALARAGYQEAVLTGVHLGSYGHDLGRGNGLRELVAAVLSDTDIRRLRLSSLEPWDLGPDFFTLWANRRLLPHLHLPLQSGSDRILRRMARHTSRAGFGELAAAARAHIADLNLSTDVIVGFPGETEADFQASLAYVEEVGFARLHVFTYSRRPGTAAARMADQVGKATKRERSRRMLEAGRALGLAFHRRYEGSVMDVLWESAVGADDGGLRWAGYSDNYMRVMANGPADLSNRVARARLGEARPDSLSGVLV